jgi:hypothetical protein
MDLNTIERLNREWEALAREAETASAKYYACIQNTDSRGAAIADRNAMDAAYAAAKAKRLEGSEAMRIWYDENCSRSGQ